MTNKEYILSKLVAFEVSEAQLADMEIDLEDTYKPNSPDVGIAMILLVEELILAPRRTNITENGFSVSWNYADLGKYYLYLCKRYGATANDKILDLLGLSRIVDRTDTW